MAQRELVRADQHLGEPCCAVRASCSSLSFGSRSVARDQELLEQLLLPLLAQARRRDDQDAALALGPVLRDDDARFDRLPEADLVGEDDAVQVRRLEREEGRIDLMRLRLNLGIEKQARKFADVVVRVGTLKLVGVVLRLVGR